MNIYDLVQVMAVNNPHIELLTIWGFTKEEIERRWEVHNLFDPIERLFNKNKSKTPGSKEVDSSPQMLSLLENYFPMVDEAEEQ